MYTAPPDCRACLCSFWSRIKIAISSSPRSNTSPTCTTTVFPPTHSGFTASPPSPSTPAMRNALRAWPISPCTSPSATTRPGAVTRRGGYGAGAGAAAAAPPAVALMGATARPRNGAEAAAPEKRTLVCAGTRARRSAAAENDRAALLNITLLKGEDDKTRDVVRLKGRHAEATALPTIPHHHSGLKRKTCTRADRKAFLFAPRARWGVTSWTTSQDGKRERQ